jgi:hypothetical protein
MRHFKLYGSPAGHPKGNDYLGEGVELDDGKHVVSLKGTSACRIFADLEMLANNLPCRVEYEPDSPPPIEELKPPQPFPRFGLVPEGGRPGVGIYDLLTAEQGLGPGEWNRVGEAAVMPDGSALAYTITGMALPRFFVSLEDIKKATGLRAVKMLDTNPPRVGGAEAEELEDTLELKVDPEELQTFEAKYSWELAVEEMMEAEDARCLQAIRDAAHGAVEFHVTAFNEAGDVVATVDGPLTDDTDAVLESVGLSEGADDVMEVTKEFTYVRRGLLEGLGVGEEQVESTRPVPMEITTPGGLTMPRRRNLQYLTDIEQLLQAVMRAVEGAPPSEAGTKATQALQAAADRLADHIEEARGPEWRQKLESKENSVTISQAWGDFTGAGMLWWVNRILHTFGWSIAVQVGDDDAPIYAVPVRTPPDVLGFDNETNTSRLEWFRRHMHDEVPDPG